MTIEEQISQQIADGIMKEFDYGNSLLFVAYKTYKKESNEKRKLGIRRYKLKLKSFITTKLLIDVKGENKCQ